MASLTTLKTMLCGSDGSQGVLQDSSYYSAITTWINDAVTAIAAGIRMPDGQISPPLPDLFDTDTVDTSTDNAYVSLPSDYQRNLFMVADSSGYKISYPRNGGYYSWGLFIQQISMKDLSETGDVSVVCVRGTKLYYQGIPSSSKTLTVHFYRAPVDLSDDDDEVDGIPEHLQKRLIKHWVCKEIFGEGLEDADNSGKSAVAYHTAKFYEAMTDLIDYVGLYDETPQYFGTDAEEYEW